MSKTQKKTDSPHSEAPQKPPTGGPLDPCAAAAVHVESYFQQLALSKVNQLQPCDEHEADCACHGGGTSGGQTKVDLVVIIDTSGSMFSKADQVSKAADAALEMAKKECGVDLRDEWFGLDGVFPGTRFDRPLHGYLSSLGSFTFAAQMHPEEGADAIADTCNFFDWRRDACRVIFYISDEALNLGDGQDAGDDAATVNAIATAIAQQVKVFAHFAPPNSGNAGTIQNYTDLCVQTGGEAFISNPTTVDEYQVILKTAICEACSGCKTAEFPEVAPCISVSWGDSDCDCMETNDFEVLAITVCNCYSNIAFENLMIGQISVTDASGNPVALLPDGAPSVEVHPPGALCFGRIGPCVDGTPTCVTRQVVLYTRGAKAGSYQLKFDAVCYSISYLGHTEACFSFHLCKD